ncbi:UNVERIFIED_CONTAM: hypothetical protein FKN15_030761 [Acipenser sinensis]
MNTRCPPKCVPSSRPLFFHTADSPCSHPRATASEDNTALGQLTGKPAGARPDYRGRWCAICTLLFTCLYIVSYSIITRFKKSADFATGRVVQSGEHRFTCAKSSVFAGDPGGIVALVQVLPWVWEAKPSGTASPHHATADPTSQVPSELRADTCRAGLCPPGGGSSLRSALEFLGVEVEAGSVVGSEDSH